ncbi:PHP domain-containing protein [Lacimicrobium alkaliphilum]|uniref:S-adenosylmethionine tRNA ribosyltransferase n=1 Tax=Lacimicrobium alkaliphilum TaxID=1526571 RepID=A0A0U2Z750_9ALTE|nr:PHP domain-containing protein [Lacimicrobium alkaliphilum]ALS98755.1 S-adenosylmethionine tRNA ribosyltransferase [Lacimicrobium alkaliphilum]
MKIDLHSHTYYSDGALSPKELIDRAHNMQLDVLAITDHDTTAALPEALAYQETQKRPLRIIPGIEFSTRWHGFDIHILGLNVDHHNEVFQQRIARQGERRDLRARQMAEKLARCGIEEVYDEARTLAGPGQLTRSHFARVLVKRKMVKDFEQAFKRYLGKGKRAFVTPAWPEIHEAIEWINQAGGEAVLAHPARYDMTSKWLKRLLNDFTQAGGQGMEVSHPQLAADTRKLLGSYAKDYGLRASAGSDFHFPGRWTELGKNLSLADDLVPIWQHWNLA